MEPIRLRIEDALKFLPPDSLYRMHRKMARAHHLLHDHQGPFSAYLGWMELPNLVASPLLKELQETAEKIRLESEAVVLVGIGGSYLGTRAVEQMLQPAFVPPRVPKKGQPLLFYTGQHLSAEYLCELLNYLQEHEVSVIAVSKSGTTTEPALIFRILRQWMFRKYGEQAVKRIYTITDPAEGNLRKMSEHWGFTSFPVPPDVGGRYSVLSAVGLLPLAVSGVDVESLLKGAQAAKARYDHPDWTSNDAYLYAALRYLLYGAGKWVEILVHHLPQMESFSAWWKQLYGESEGKQGQGIFPASAQYSTDLHAIGQYIQDGKRALFETVLRVLNAPVDILVEQEEGNLDELDYLAGRSLEWINQQALEGALQAHLDGGVPHLQLDIPDCSPHYAGELIYFFQKSCAVSGLLFDVNPFDQPGVDAYKRNMFALLGKPGYGPGPSDSLKQVGRDPG